MFKSRVCVSAFCLVWLIIPNEIFIMDTINLIM